MTSSELPFDQEVLLGEVPPAGAGHAGREAVGEGDGAPGAAQRRPRRWRRHWRVALLAVAACVVVLVACVGWYELQAHPGGPAGRQETITVAPGESTGSVVDKLAAHGVVTSGVAYRIYLLVHGAPTIRAGTYLVRQNLSFQAVTSALAGGPNMWALDVPAGFTLAEVAARYGEVTGRSAAGFVQVARSGAVRSPWEAAGSTNLEGLLAPGTYLVHRKESDRQVLDQMVSRFDRQAAAAGLDAAVAAFLGVTPNQLITVASIVEKEGYIQKNMGRVARVVYNRLADGMPLQMDSTVLYSLGRDGGPVTGADERINTPYNTYLHTGLPPTPIDVPSAAALEAAGHPTSGSWLYFVVVAKDGTEAFSTTYAGQLANEALARSRGVA